MTDERSKAVIAALQAKEADWPAIAHTAYLAHGEDESNYPAHAASFAAYAMDFLDLIETGRVLTRMVYNSSLAAIAASQTTNFSAAAALHIGLALGDDSSLRQLIMDMYPTDRLLTLLKEANDG